VERGRKKAAKRSKSGGTAGSGAVATFHGVNAYPLARARRSGAVTLWEKVDSLTPGIARRGDMLLVQIAEAEQIRMADFLNLDACRARTKPPECSPTHSSHTGHQEDSMRSASSNHCSGRSGSSGFCQ
jgi:hypothetical protein